MKAIYVRVSTEGQTYEEEYGIRCFVVIVYSKDLGKAHVLIAFDTTDWGFRCFEPQSDKEVNPLELSIWS